MRLVADTSAFAAVLLREADGNRYRQKLLEARSVLISAVTAVELHMVVATRNGPAGILLLNELIEQPLFEVVPTDDRQVRLARNAFDRYGRGRHAAALNFGDVFSYALARHLDLPLLYKGNDFSQTDVASAIAPG